MSNFLAFTFLFLENQNTFSILENLLPRSRKIDCVVIGHALSRAHSLARFPLQDPGAENAPLGPAFEGGRPLPPASLSPETRGDGSAAGQPLSGSAGRTEGGWKAAKSGADDARLPQAPRSRNWTPTFGIWGDPAACSAGEVPAFGRYRGGSRLCTNVR